jgi:hypothetical protein
MDRMESSPPSAQLLHTFARTYQHYLDKTNPQITGRWVSLLVVLLMYTARVFHLQGFYIVTYGLGIYNLNLLLGFLSPQVDPEVEEGPELPTKSNQEFKPFIRRLPEFKFWCDYCLVEAAACYWLLLLVASKLIVCAPSLTLQALVLQVYCDWASNDILQVL